MVMNIIAMQIDRRYFYNLSIAFGK